MPQYRRVHQPGGIYFLTLVAAKRVPIFQEAAAVDVLRQAVREVIRLLPFDIHAAVVLPDHMHFLWKLPEDDSDYSKRIGMIKVAVTRALGRFRPASVTLGDSKFRHRDAGLWQRRFWEHTIRDEVDYARHMDYIHFNPIKHGLARCAHEWPYSSFRVCVRRRLYAPDWCCACHGKHYDPPDFDDINEGAEP